VAKYVHLNTKFNAVIMKKSLSVDRCLIWATFVCKQLYQNIRIWLFCGLDLWHLTACLCICISDGLWEETGNLLWTSWQSSRHRVKKSKTFLHK